MTRKIFALPLLLAMVILMSACSSEETYVETNTVSEPRLITELKEYNSNLIDVNSTRTDVVSDETFSVVEADLIGAFEGAIKGVEYAIDKEMSEDEAIVVIITSAVIHGAARSHQAYLDHHENHYVMQSLDSEDTQNATNQLNNLRKDVVALNVSDMVRNSKWNVYNMANIDSKYQHADVVGKKHNAILSNIYNASSENYENNLLLYTPAEQDYLTSPVCSSNFISIVSNPFDTSFYSEIDVNSSSDSANVVMSLFLNAVNTAGRSASDYMRIMNTYLSTVSASTELNSYEKESLYMGFVVGLYSMGFWTTERTLD